MGTGKKKDDMFPVYGSVFGEVHVPAFRNLSGQGWIKLYSVVVRNNRKR